MSHSFFAMVARMRYINRWSLMRNTLKENLEEHSLQVAIIAHALAVIRQELFPVDKAGERRLELDPSKISLYAIYHDVDEILVGDMPTPVKYFNKDIETIFKKMEEEASQKLIKMLPESFESIYTDLLTPDKDDPVIAESLLLVKAADKISALIKCVEEEKAGNTEFTSAAKSLRTVIDNLGLEEVDYFMEVFFPSYSLTLDELEGLYGDK